MPRGPSWIGLKLESKSTNGKFDKDFYRQEVLETGRFLPDAYKITYPKINKYLTNCGSILLGSSSFLFTVLINCVMKKNERNLSSIHVKKC